MTIVDDIEQEYVAAIDAIDPMVEGVYMHVYDLNDSAKYVNQVVLDFFGYGGILHVGIEVFGEEYSFGMQGVSRTSQPKWHHYYKYRSSELVGRTSLKQPEVHALIASLQEEWKG